MLCYIALQLRVALLLTTQSPSLKILVPECHLFYKTFLIAPALSTLAILTRSGAGVCFCPPVAAHQFCLDTWSLPLCGGTVNQVVHLPLSWMGHKTWLGQSAALSLQGRSWGGDRKLLMEDSLTELLLARSPSCSDPCPGQELILQPFHWASEPPWSRDSKLTNYSICPQTFISQPPAVRADLAASSDGWH